MRPAGLLLALAIASTCGAQSREPHADVEAAASLVVEGTNAFRRTEGREAVHREPHLDRAAREFARYMARTERYGHEADGREPAQRAEAQGYDYCAVLENIAYHFDSRGFATRRLAETDIEGWKNSPGHRKNMLNRHVTDTGVGIARGANGYYYSVQMFGLPRSQSVKFEVRNESSHAVRYRVGDQPFNAPPRTIRTHEVCMHEAVRFEGLARASEAIEPRPGDRFVIPAEGGAVLRQRR